MVTTESGSEKVTKADDYVGQQRAVETRLVILKHASQIFSAKGFDNCSTREIAAAAGVGHANIRYHFGDKQTVWLKVIQYLIADAYQGRKLLAEIQSGASPMQNFWQHTRNVISYYAYHPELPRIILFETMSNSERLAMIESAMSEVHEQRAQSIEILQKAGVIKDIDSRLLNEFVAGALNSIFIASKEIDRSDKNKLERTIDQYADFIVELVQK